MFIQANFIFWHLIYACLVRYQHIYEVENIIIIIIVLLVMHIIY